MVKTVKKRGYNRRSKRMNRSRLSRNKRPQTTRKKRNRGKSNFKSKKKQTTRRKRNDIKYSLRKQTKRKKSKRKISTGVGSVWVGGGAKGGAKGRKKSSKTGKPILDSLLRIGKGRREREKNKKANTEVGWLAAPGATVDIEYADPQKGPTTPSLKSRPLSITGNLPFEKLSDTTIGFRTIREIQEGDGGATELKKKKVEVRGDSPVETTSSGEAPRVSSSKNRYTAAIVPPGKKAGDMIQIQSPGGDMFQVKIPDGFTVGQSFPIEIPESPTDQTSDISDTATEATEATAVPATTAIAPIGNLLENINLNDYKNILDNVQSEKFTEEDKGKLDALAKMLQGQSVEDQSDSKMQKLQGYIIKLYGLLGNKLKDQPNSIIEKVKELIEKLVAKVTKQPEQKGGGGEDVDDDLLKVVEEMIKFLDNVTGELTDESIDGYLDRVEEQLKGSEEEGKSDDNQD